MNDHTKHVADALSISTTLAALAGWLPSIAALVTIIWTLIRIWETKTVQKAVQRIFGKEASK